MLWSQLGLNQRPPDYESGATNQLSYRTILNKEYNHRDTPTIATAKLQFFSDITKKIEKFFMKKDTTYGLSLFISSAGNPSTYTGGTL